MIDPMSRDALLLHPPSRRGEDGRVAQGHGEGEGRKAEQNPFSELGITEKQSSEFQQLAAVPKAQFDAADHVSTRAGAL
jgi:hypothetical protein